MTTLTESQLRALIRQEAVGSTASRAPAKMGHDTVKDLLECPDCYKEVIKQLDESEYACSDCHLPMSERVSAKLATCPRCGGDHREKVEH